MPELELGEADDYGGGSRQLPALPQASLCNAPADAVAIADRPVIELAASAVSAGVMMQPATLAPTAAGTEVEQPRPRLSGARLSSMEELALRTMPHGQPLRGGALLRPGAAGSHHRPSLHRA
jgi:hypothetical protein